MGGRSNGENVNYRGRGVAKGTSSYDRRGKAFLVVLWGLKYFSLFSYLSLFSCARACIQSTAIYLNLWCYIRHWVKEKHENRWVGFWSSVGHEPARVEPRPLLEPGKTLARADSSRLEPPRCSSVLESPRYLSMFERARAARILLQARADLLIPFRSWE